MKNLILITIISIAICNNLIKAHEKNTISEAIDVVYLWVDGNDPEWQKIKDIYLSKESPEDIPTQSKNSDSSCFLDHDSSNQNIIYTDGTTSNRFSDNEELRYSLRSINCYAPFIRHIYIVTMNQTPSWLKPDPKITLINHTEIFTRAENLPTFNSHALESNLHRIPGLSERFIYFNDDVFLGGPVQAHDFFKDDEKINVLFEEGLSPSGPAIQGETLYRRAWRNSNNFLDTHFIVERRHRLKHAPFALRKSYIESFEADFPHIFAQNSSHRFRSEHDFNVTNGLLQYYWLYKNLIVSESFDGYITNNIMVSLRDDTQYKKTEKALKKISLLRPATFCLQDIMGENSSKTKKLLRNFLENYYPDKAPWEK